MKVLDPSFLLALTSKVRTLTRCARIERQDGAVFGLTEFDRDLTFAGTTYRAVNGLSPTAIQSDLDFQSNNIQFSGLINEDITATDLRLGLFNYARIQLFLVNYLDLPDSLVATPEKRLVFPVRVIGRISYSEGDYTAELMGLTRFLEGRKASGTSRTCRYTLGDSRCTVNIEDFKSALIVTEERDEFSFRAVWTGQDVHRFTGGEIEWTSGANDGLKIPCIQHIGNEFFFPTPLPNSIEPGDTFLATPRCGKRLEDCRTFNNQPNFGGEDDLPGVDAYISLEDQG